MPKVMIHHEVDDADHWLAQSTREDVFGSLGISGITTYVNPQDRSQVGLTMDVPDLDALLAMVQSPEGIEAMKNDGVRADTVVFCVES
jgi:hypothetical protein